MASGPSLCAEDAHKVRDWQRAGHGKVIVVNTTFRMAPWADVLYACDGGWWREYGPEVDQKFTGRRFCYAQYGTKHDATQVPSTGRTGLSKTPGSITTGGNSGHQAIHLAYNFGAKKIILLGFDMAYTGGQSHWHGNHPSGLGNATHLHAWVKLMRFIAADLKAAGVEVLNCSRVTALDCFDRSPLDDALCAS